MYLKKLIKTVCLVLLLSSMPFPVNALSSSINDIYNVELYYSPHGPHVIRYGLPLPLCGVLAVRFTIRLSIQTEPDGTWKGNNQYAGIIEALLEWYNCTLFPHGIEIVIKPEVNEPSYPWGQIASNYMDNITFYNPYNEKANNFSIGDTSNVILYGYGYMNMLIKPKKYYHPPYPYNVPLQLKFRCKVFNGSRNNYFGGYIYYSQLFNIARTPDTLSGSANISEDLANIKNLMYVLVVLVCALTGASATQILYIKKYVKNKKQ